MKNLFQDLMQRGIIKQVTHNNLEERLEKPITLYCGFDPTADSLHVGSLLPLITLLRFKNAGHNVLPLIGGATGMIGDPSGKSQERTLNSLDTIDNFKQSISKQINQLLSVECIDNLSWAKEINMLSFLRDFGKFFTVNSMLAKESVKNRIEREDQGISFTEFSYSIIQAMDFFKLFEMHNCQLQIGGSDQWGNITAGTELIRRKLGNDIECFGLTMPLLTNSDGKKFGKSEQGTVWLDPNKTSPFKFFQFWLLTSDNDVYNFLRLFSFKTLEEINDIEKHDKESGKRPIAQQILAEELTAIVHGQDALNSVLRINEALFSSDFSKLNLIDLIQLKNDGLPFFEIKNDTSLIDALVISKLATSKRQARDFVTSGAISFNGHKLQDLDFNLNIKNTLLDNFIILKRGKNNFSLISLCG